VTVAALYVEEGGAYYGLPDVDPWPEARDARLYAGPWPVVAHPPCARWCMLAELVQSKGGGEVGDDGGTFEAALDAVRRFGGVLEHPAWTKAWRAFGLPRPASFGWTHDLFGVGWVCEVSQAAYGHRAPKATWLYYVGDVPPPPMLWARPPCGVSMTTSRRRSGSVEMTSHRERSATPPAFRDVLLSLARGARPAEGERLATWAAVLG
jgi:hypothetical protein